MKKFELVVLSVVLLLVAAAATSSRPFTVGVVDYNKVLTSTTEWKIAQAKIEGIRAEKLKQYQVLADAAKTASERLSTESNAEKKLDLTVAARVAKNSADRYAEDAVRDLEAIQAQANIEARKKINDAVMAVAKAQNVAIILNKDTGLYAAPAIDLTNAVIKAVNGN